MTWPQIVIAGWLLFVAFCTIKREVENRQQSSGMAMFGIVFTFVLLGGIAAVLHAGDFW